MAFRRRKLIPRVESLKIGTSIDPSADYGPLVTRAALDRVKAPKPETNGDGSSQQQQQSQAHGPEQNQQQQQQQQQVVD